MTVSVSSVRQDKLKSPGKGVKCGGGYISQGEKCGKSNNSTRAKIEKAAQIGGGLIGFGSVIGSAGAYLAGKPGLAMNIGRVGTAANAVAGAGMVSEGRRTKNKELVKEGKGVLMGSAVGAAIDFGVNKALQNVRTSGSPFKTGPKEGGSSLYAGPKPKRDPIIGPNGLELREKNNQYARWQKRTKEVENLENSFKAPNNNVENIRKLNRIYKGPSAKRDRKDSKKPRSVWAAGSKVTDGENYRDC